MYTEKTNLHDPTEEHMIRQAFSARATILASSEHDRFWRVSCMVHKKQNLD